MYFGFGWSRVLVSTNQGLNPSMAVDSATSISSHACGVGLAPKTSVRRLHEAHADHYGGAARIQERYGARVAMGEADWAAIAEAPAPGQQVRVRPPKRDIALKDGDTIKLGSTTLKFHATPGHTPGTVSVDFTVFDRGTAPRLCWEAARPPGHRPAEQFVASM